MSAVRNPYTENSVSGTVSLTPEVCKMDLKNINNNFFLNKPKNFLFRLPGPFFVSPYTCLLPKKFSCYMCFLSHSSVSHENASLAVLNVFRGPA